MYVTSYIVGRFITLSNSLVVKYFLFESYKGIDFMHVFEKKTNNVHKYL